MVMSVPGSLLRVVQVDTIVRVDDFLYLPQVVELPDN
jgi:hypothetical protein